MGAAWRRSTKDGRSLRSDPVGIMYPECIASPLIPNPTKSYIPPPYILIMCCTVLFVLCLSPILITDKHNTKSTVQHIISMYGGGMYDLVGLGMRGEAIHSGYIMPTGSDLSERPSLVDLLHAAGVVAVALQLGHVVHVGVSLGAGGLLAVVVDAQPELDHPVDALAVHGGVLQGEARAQQRRLEE